MMEIEPDRNIIKEGIAIFFTKQARLHNRVLRAHSIPVDISLEEAGMTHTVAGQKSLPINLSSTSYWNPLMYFSRILAILGPNDLRCALMQESLRCWELERMPRWLAMSPVRIASSKMLSVSRNLLREIICKMRLLSVGVKRMPRIKTVGCSRKRT